ncbi:hypothetical protein ACFPFV_06310 [Salinicoccus siamensis]
MADPLNYTKLDCSSYIYLKRSSPIRLDEAASVVSSTLRATQVCL